MHYGGIFGPVAGLLDHEALRAAADGTKSIGSAMRRAVAGAIRGFWGLMRVAANQAQAWRYRHPLRLAGALIVLGLVVFVWGVFFWPVDVAQDVGTSTGPATAGAAAAQDRAVATDNASKRTVVLALLGGLIAGGGLWVSISNHRRQTTHDAHVHEKDRQDLVHQRYATAIEHLDSDNPAVQAAAIYALEDVIESEKERRVAIVQTLVALSAKLWTETANSPSSEPGESPDVRLIAAQIVLARRKDTLGAPPAQMPYSNLRSFILREADLRKANLTMADMAGAVLVDAKLDGANLTFADLGYSDATNASLVAANLDTADLSYVDFSSANLTRADLTAASLVGANLANANLTRAHLAGADLSNADLTKAQLDEVESWDGANVWGVKGMPDGWCPHRAVREPPEDEGGEDEGG